MTLGKRGQEKRGQERNRNKKKDEREGGRKTVIRSRRCLNCKWVNVTLTAEQPDRYMMELSSLTVLCHCPVKKRVRVIFSFYVQFHWYRRTYDKWKGRGKHPFPSKSLCFSITHTTIVRRPTFPFFERVLFSRAARWGLIPVIPHLILVRIEIEGTLLSFSYFPFLTSIFNHNAVSLSQSRSLSFLWHRGAEKAWPLRFPPSLRLVLNTQQIKAQAWKLTLAIY